MSGGQSTDFISHFLALPPTGGKAKTSISKCWQMSPPISWFNNFHQ